MKEQVEVGDWSKDGHNQSDKFIIEVPDDIDSDGAYQLAVREIGFKMDDYCNSYEDTKFPVECFEKILETAKKYNIPITSVVFDEYSDLDRDEDEPGDYVYLYAEGFFALWLAMLNIGIAITRGPNVAGALAYEVKPTKQSKTHHIGGYGLYS